MVPLIPVQLAALTIAGLFYLWRDVLRRRLVHTRVLVRHIDLRKLMTQPGLEIIRIMCRSDFHSSSSELRIRQIISNDGDFTVHQWQTNFLAVQMTVAFVFLVYRDSGVPEHGLRTGGRDCDVLAATDHWVANFVQLALYLFVLHLEIRDCGSASGAPVDDVLPAVNQAFFVEANEYFAHGT